LLCVLHRSSTRRVPSVIKFHRDGENLQRVCCENVTVNAASGG
jgi:hypothetical protein